MEMCYTCIFSYYNGYIPGRLAAQLLCLALTYHAVGPGLDLLDTVNMEVQHLGGEGQRSGPQSQSSINSEFQPAWVAT